jgi:tRNA 2-selenouridine synthase
VRERERESERERGYSAIIDVRTPAEFAVDHVPGAINLPVLSDLERHQVGLLFASEHFQGRKLGAQLISANIAQLLAAHFADKPSAYCPLIYCWRGGQRSNSLAHVLCEVGFRCSVLQVGQLIRNDIHRLQIRGKKHPLYTHKTYSYTHVCRMGISASMT